MTPKQLESILLLQIKELKSDLSKVSYEVSTRSLEKSIDFKNEQLENVRTLLKSERESE